MKVEQIISHLFSDAEYQCKYRLSTHWYSLDIMITREEETLSCKSSCFQGHSPNNRTTGQFGSWMRFIVSVDSPIAGSGVTILSSKLRITLEAVGMAGSGAGFCRLLKSWAETWKKTRFKTNWWCEGNCLQDAIWGISLVNTYKPARTLHSPRLS